MSSQDQQHPQYHKDREIVNNLLQQEPTDYNLVELARLNIRYRGFPGARDIQTDIAQAMQKWGLTEDNLYEKTRSIHAQGQVYKKNQGEEEDWI